MNSNLIFFWVGVLVVFATEVFVVALVSYISSHFYVEEEDDDGSTEKRN